MGTFSEGNNAAKIKLLPAEVQRLREMYRSGLYTQAALAEKFNVTDRTVRRIVNGESRKTVLRSQYELKYDSEDSGKRVLELVKLKEKEGKMEEMLDISLPVSQSVADMYIALGGKRAVKIEKEERSVKTEKEIEEIKRLKAERLNQIFEKEDAEKTIDALSLLQEKAREMKISDEYLKEI